MAKKKILCTGSGGFIFSNFVRYVLKNNSNYQIVSIDNCTNPNVLNTIYSNKGHNFYVADCRDPHIINTIFELERPDIVIHGAARSFVDASISAPQEFVKNNVVGTQVMIDAAVKWSVERFIYISSDEIYGQLTSEDESSWSEASLYNPRNPYSSTKASGELLVLAAHNTYGLPYNITRSCNNYGPRQPKRNLIPVVIANILDNKQIPIYGEGLQVRDWIYVEDNCQAILTIIEKAPLNEIYNISAKQEFTNLEVVQKICNVLEQGHELITHISDPRPGHDYRYSITNDKIKSLGWEPQLKFNNGIEKTIQWYVQNKWFIR